MHLVEEILEIRQRERQHAHRRHAERRAEHRVGIDRAVAIAGHALLHEVHRTGAERGAGRRVDQMRRSRQRLARGGAPAVRARQHAARGELVLQRGGIGVARHDSGRAGGRTPLASLGWPQRAEMLQIDRGAGGRWPRRRSGRRVVRLDGGLFVGQPAIAGTAQRVSEEIHDDLNDGISRAPPSQAAGKRGLFGDSRERLATVGAKRAKARAGY
ncbi:MAG: hypothetical protein V4801_02150 [Burkholderia gladioli]